MGEAASDNKVGEPASDKSARIIADMGKHAEPVSVTPVSQNADKSRAGPCLRIPAEVASLVSRGSRLAQRGGIRRGRGATPVLWYTCKMRFARQTNSASRRSKRARVRDQIWDFLGRTGNHVGTGVSGNKLRAERMQAAKQCMGSHVSSGGTPSWANLGSLQPSSLPTSESWAGIREGVLGSQLGARALPNPNIPLCTASLLLAEQGGIGVIVYDICGPAIAHIGRDAAAAEEV